MQLAALRLLTAPSSERSLCIKGPNQIFILQNQHLYNQYNKYVSVLTWLNRTMCYTKQGANNNLHSKQRVSSAGPLRIDAILA